MTQDEDNTGDHPGRSGPAPQAMTAPVERQERVKRILLLVMLCSGVVLGCLDVVFAGTPDVTKGLAILQALIVALAIAAWCHYDALQRGHTLGVVLRLLVLFIAVIGFPICAFKTRGTRGFILIAGALGFLVLLGAAHGLGASAAERLMNLVGR